MRKINIIIMVLLVTLGILFLDFKDVKADGAGMFSVDPVFPDNQIKKADGYYLLVKPGQKQQISFKITNLQNTSQQFHIMPGMFVNNSEGEMSFTANKKLFSKSLPFNMLDMGVKPTIVTIPARKTYQVNQLYQLPNKSFKGLVYGGIRVTSTSVQSSQELKNKKQQTIINTYGEMVTGVIWTMDKKYPIGDIKINKVYPINATPTPVFQVQLSNDQGTIIDHLNLKARITKSGIGIANTSISKIDISNTFNNYTVAPYSNFTLNLDIGRKRLQAGNYELELTASTHGHKINKKYRFMITEPIAHAINKDNSKILPDYTFLYFLIVIIAIVLLIFFVIFMYFYGMKKILQPNKEMIKKRAKLNSLASKNPKVPKRKRN